MLLQFSANNGVIGTARRRARQRQRWASTRASFPAVANLKNAGPNKHAAVCFDRAVPLQVQPCGQHRPAQALPWAATLRLARPGSTHRTRAPERGAVGRAAGGGAAPQLKVPLRSDLLVGALAGLRWQGVGALAGREVEFPAAYR